jgi:hypothetical protein
MIDIKKLAQFMSKPEHFQYVNAAKDANEKQLRINSLKRKFEQSNFANFANSYVEDYGNPEADFLLPERQETSLNDIKIECVKFGVRDSIKQYVLQRNEVSRRNRAKQKEKEKAKENKHVSHPFWY